MGLENTTLIVEDYHRTHAYCLNNEFNNNSELSSPPINPKTRERACMSLLDMAPWEWIKPTALLGDGDPTITQYQTFYPFFRYLALSDNEAKEATNHAITHYQQLTVGMNLQNHAPNIDFLKQYIDDHQRLIGPWVSSSSNQKGMEKLQADGHKVVILSGIWFELEPAFTTHLIRSHDWQILSQMEPSNIPSAILRACILDKNAILSTSQVTGIRTRLNHLGQSLIYPEASDYKYLSCMLLSRVAKALGMEFIVGDDDPENILPLAEENVRVFTPISIEAYRQHFVNRGPRFEDYSDRIASYNGFSSNLATIAGIEDERTTGQKQTNLCTTSW